MGHRYEMVSFGLGFGRLDDPIRSSGVIEPWTEADEGGDRQLDRMVESGERDPLRGLGALLGSGESRGGALH